MLTFPAIAFCSLAIALPFAVWQLWRDPKKSMGANVVGRQAIRKLRPG